MGMPRQRDESGLTIGQANQGSLMNTDFAIFITIYEISTTLPNGCHKKAAPVENHISLFLSETMV